MSSKLLPKGAFPVPFAEFGDHSKQALHLREKGHKDRGGSS